MNCKPGEPVRVVYKNALAEGYVFTVLQIHSAGHDGWNERFGAVWSIDTEVPVRLGDILTSTLCSYPDSLLLPIRPGESPEESIEAMRLLTHIPNKETA